MTRKIYVASSWRNPNHNGLVTHLKQKGHEVLDYRRGKGFKWEEISPNWEDWIPDEYREGLTHRLAEKGFDRDYGDMKKANTCILVLPSGRSSHIEAGWFTGQGKPTAIFIPGQYEWREMEPELMYKLADRVILGRKELDAWLNTLDTITATIGGA